MSVRHYLTNIALHHYSPFHFLTLRLTDIDTDRWMQKLVFKQSVALSKRGSRHPDILSISRSYENQKTPSNYETQWQLSQYFDSLLMVMIRDEAHSADCNISLEIIWKHLIQQQQHWALINIISIGKSKQQNANTIINRLCSVYCL